MSRKIPEKIKPIVEEIKKKLKEIYGEHLKGIILYGSYARRDFTAGSDIDFIMLLDDMKDPIVEHEKYFDAIWELDLKYDTVISIIPFREEEYRTRRTPIILNAEKEGITV